MKNKFYAYATTWDLDNKPRYIRVIVPEKDKALVSIWKSNDKNPEQKLVIYEVSVDDKVAKALNMPAQDKYFNESWWKKNGKVIYKRK